MNSISYLDSVLSRSFAPATETPPSRPSSSSKRSRSHSSLPSSRRASSTTTPTPSGSSSLRRWSQEQEEPNRALYSSNKLRRTGSTPSGIHQALDTSDSDSDSQHSRSARWSGLWGLTGWIDDAIHPGSSTRTRKNSDSELSYRRAKRIPSLDDLLLSSTAPRRDVSRRNASSGSGQVYRRSSGSSNSIDESHSHIRRRSRRNSRSGQTPSFTLISASPDQGRQQWSTHEDSTLRHHDPDQMTEKEREDVVEFDGGDFSPEDLERPRERSISQSSADSSWGEGSSVSHDDAMAVESASLQQHESADADPVDSQDDVDEKSVDAETLLEAAKGEPEAIEAVAQEDPASSVVDPAATSATPKRESTTVSGAAADADETPTNFRKKQSDSSTSGTTTPSVSRNGSLRRKQDPSLAMGPLLSSSSSSLDTVDSEKTVDRSLTSSKPKRRRSARTSANSSARASEAEDSRTWLASRNGNVHTTDDITTARYRHPKRKSSNAKRAVRRTLLALRDLLLAVLLCPVNCVRYLRRRRVIRAEEVVDAIREQAQVPILEKNGASSDESSSRSKRPPSLRFASKTELKRDEEKRNGTASRPRTPKPDAVVDEKDVSVGFFDNEPVTEDQAAALGTVWRALSSGQRTPSRLLPNPQMIDPMYAHDSRAAPIDIVMAEKEAVMEAERQSKIAKSRAARRAATVDGASDARSFTPPSALLPTKVPRGPTSSIIHHSPKILVLDLDETLIHSTSRSPTHFTSGRTTTSGFLGLETAGAFLGLRANDNPRRIRPHMVEVVLDGRSVLYHVYKRPWTDYFLRKVASWYTVVIFTASVQEYADPVIDWLDQGRGLISARLFRESCEFKKGQYVKNLQVVEKDLSKVCLVDNSPASYRLNRENGIPVEGWTSDPNDEALLDLLPVLDSLRFATDVRHILGIRGW